MNINNPTLDEISSDTWYGEGINTVDFSKDRLQLQKDNMHYDRNFDGFIMKAIYKFTGVLPSKNIQYEDTWWKMDDYLRR